MRLIGIFGGSFDPIHKGHLSVAKQAKARLALDQVRFIPLHRLPQHKNTIATATQRLEMLKLALARQAHFIIDRRELERNMLSYTLFTLQSLRADFPKASLVLLMGDDAFANINSWKEPERLLDYAHIVFIKRILDAVPVEVRHFMKQRLTTDTAALQRACHGYIYPLDISPIAISSSQIVKRITNGLPVASLLPETVLHYIQQKQLYQS